MYFGGVKGAAIRDFYRSVTYDVCNPDGTVETLALFPDIKPHTQFYTFSHPQGLLSATQFTQPALVLFEKASFEDLRSKYGFLSPLTQTLFLSFAYLLSLSSASALCLLSPRLRWCCSRRPPSRTSAPSVDACSSLSLSSTCALCLLHPDCSCICEGFLRRPARQPRFRPPFFILCADWVLLINLIN